MEILETLSGKQIGYSQTEAAQKSEKALAIKQRWQQVFDVLDIDLDHGALIYGFDQGNDSKMGFTNQQPLNQVSVGGDFTISGKESLFGDVGFTYAETVNSPLVKGNQPTTLNGLDIGIEKSISAVSDASLQHQVFLNASTGMARKAVQGNITQQLNEAVSTKTIEPTIIGNVSNYREAVARGAATNIAGSSSTNPVVKIKHDTNVTQPSQVSLTNAEGGFVILARDYRVNEKFLTKKLVDSLKAILLAGGVLKKILMNGKTIF